jgi:hypothetical protein
MIDMVLAADMPEHQVYILKQKKSRSIVVLYSKCLQDCSSNRKCSSNSKYTRALTFKNLYQRIVSLLKQEMPSRLEAAHTKVTDNGTDEGGHGAANTRANCVTRLDIKGLSLMVCAGEMRICYVSNTFLNLEGRQQCIQWCIQRCIQRCILDAACR